MEHTESRVAAGKLIPGYKVASFSDPKKFYYVRFIDNHWKCNCPDFLFREREHVACKHILKVIEENKKA